MSEELHTGETNSQHQDQTSSSSLSLAKNLLGEADSKEPNTIDHQEENEEDETAEDGSIDESANKISFMTEVDHYETQYFELEGTQVEVEPGYVLAQTYKGVFKVEHDSEFSTDNSGRLFVTNRNGHISELGVDD